MRVTKKLRDGWSLSIAELRPLVHEEMCARGATPTRMLVEPNLYETIRCLLEGTPQNFHMMKESGHPRLVMFTVYGVPAEIDMSARIDEIVLEFPDATPDAGGASNLE